jgi:hypothetical protein
VPPAKNSKHALSDCGWSVRPWGKASEGESSDSPLTNRENRSR